MNRKHAVPVLLGLLLAGTTGAILFETDGGRKWSGGAPASDGAVSARAEDNLLPPFSLPPAETGFKETVERPLFTWSRRPAPSGGTAQAMRKGQFKLAGTSVNANLSVAYLVESATGKTVAIPQGKEINGITVDTVEAIRVVLKQGEETEELRLATASSPKAPVVAAAQPGQPGLPGQPAVPGQPLPSGVAQPFYPPGMQPQTVAGVPASTGLPPGVAPAPGVNPTVPGVNPAAAAAAAAAAAQAAAADQPAARRRRFQNLPQQ